MRSMVDFTHNHHNTNRMKTRRAVWCDWSAAATKGRAALGTGTLHSHAPCEAWSPLVGVSGEAVAAGDAGALSAPSFKPPITAEVFSVFAPKSICRNRRIVVSLSPTAPTRYT